MRTLFLWLFLASPLYAGGEYGFPDANLNEEFDKNYYEHKYPNWVNARGSSLTVSNLNVSSITITGTITAPTGNFTTLTATTGTINSFMVVGTATNDDAPVGRIGEVISCSGSNVTAAASGSYEEICNIALTPGDWDVVASFNLSTAVGTTLAAGAENELVIATATDSGTGTTYGYDRLIWDWQNSFTPGSKNPYTVAIPRKRVKITATTSYYLNASITYGVSAPKLYGFMSAVRTR